MKITFNAKELNQLTVNLSNRLSIFFEPALNRVAKNPQLNILVGQNAQRRIDDAKSKAFKNKKYAKYRLKKFGNRPFQRLTNSLYNSLGQGQGFTTNQSGKIISITLTDPKARGQSRINNLLAVDNKLVTGINDLLSEEIRKDLQEVIKVK